MSADSAGLVVRSLGGWTAGRNAGTDDCLGRFGLGDNGVRVLWCGGWIWQEELRPTFEWHRFNVTGQHDVTCGPVTAEACQRSHNHDIEVAES